MSLIASCKRNFVDPWAWLRDVLRQLPLGDDPATLLPDIWLATHPSTAGPSPIEENANENQSRLRKPTPVVHQALTE